MDALTTKGHKGRTKDHKGGIRLLHMDTKCLQRITYGREIEFITKVYFHK